MAYNEVRVVSTYLSVQLLSVDVVIQDLEGAALIQTEDLGGRDAAEAWLGHIALLL